MPESMRIVCVKCYNLEQMIEGLNKAATQLSENDSKFSLRDLSRDSLCQYKDIPDVKCVYRKCDDCGTNKIQDKYQSLIRAASSQDDEFEVKWYMWKYGNETYQDRHNWHTVKSMETNSQKVKCPKFG